MGTDWIGSVQEESAGAGGAPSGLGLWSRHSAAPCTKTYLPATRPAPALVMAGEVGPGALLARLVMLVTMVGLVEGGLSPPDSSRDRTDFHHFPATTDERGELFHTFTFFLAHMMYDKQIHGNECARVLPFKHQMSDDSNCFLEKCATAESKDAPGIAKKSLIQG